MAYAAAEISSDRRATVTSPCPERDLLDRARQGDAAAFREIVETYTPRVYSLVRSLVRQDSEAEDVAQEVFFKVHAKLDSFREDSSFFTWLYRVAFNTATDHLKKRRQERSIQLEDLSRLPVEDSADSPAENLSRKDLRAEVRQAMARLPEKFRTILVLRELEGLAYEDLATVLKISKGTVESRLFRARERLRKLLEPELGGSRSGGGR
jgi:RNA polymerase sigma-70 factor (ECF subfamily)